MVAWDERQFWALHERLATEGLVDFFYWITWLGNGVVLAVIVLPLLYLTGRQRFRTHVIPLIVAVAVSGLLVNGLKIVVDRPRPEERFSTNATPVHPALANPPDRSFPSGHTQTAFGTATYLACLFPPWSPLLAILATLVGLSRIALGVHFPLDVVVGALFGIVFSIAAFIITRRKMGSTAKN